MPEIGEVARIVHYLRKHVVGRTISSCVAYEDDIVFGKVGCSAAAFQAHVTNRKVTGADQQGKYFYLTFDKAPHGVFHFGMSGWMKFDVEDTHYSRSQKGETTTPLEEWPPKYVKFLLRCDKVVVEGTERSPVEVAFVDPRRLGRIRLVDCDANDIRSTSPLKQNGPDPVRDADIVTLNWLTHLLRRKRVPVKALLLDQGNISGIGNWVGDEICYNSKIHPEQYSNTLNDEQIRRLYESMKLVCRIAVETLGDSDQFPKDWLMLYRWNKGKKSPSTLPNGDQIIHLTVGGRTSAIVPSVQKKTAAVAGDVDSDDGERSNETPLETKKRKATSSSSEQEPRAREQDVPNQTNSGRRSKRLVVKGDRKSARLHPN